MKRLVFLALIILTPSSMFAVELAPPYILVRALQDMQNQIARGDLVPQDQVGTLVKQIGDELQRAPAEAWQDQRNVHALAIFLLSGGYSESVRKKFASIAFKPDLAPLINGVFAYAAGRDRSAKSPIVAVDLAKMTASLGGHLALAQAVMLAQKMPDRALEILDYARVIAPGGLVEETALRRGTFLALENNDYERFAKLAKAYVRRFKKSGYAPEFFGSLAIAIKNIPATVLPNVVSSLNPLMVELSDGERLSMYLSLAEKALTAGKLKSAHELASAALELAKEHSPERTRASLYHTTASIFTTQPDIHSSALSDISKQHLLPGDQELLQAALSIVEIIKKPLRISQQLPDMPTSDAGEAAMTAARLLQDTDRLLQRIAK